MKTWKLTAVCLAALSFMGSSAWARPVDLSAPSGELGAANSKGYLEIWREIDDAGINFGKGSYLPLRYKFSSEDQTGGILGPGFYLPMFEARNVLIREQVMRAYLPCGKGLYFWKDSADPTRFQTVDKEWTGALSGDDFTVWRDDGWTILYHQGRLTSITTDEHHVFTWDYDGNTHMATGISEDGQPLVTVEPNAQGLVDALVFNGKRYEFGYSERPLVEMVLGQPAVSRLAVALSSFKYPDGKTEAFKFELTPERVPTVTFTDPDQKQTAYTWDTATGHIASEAGPDGNWTYKIGDIPQEFGLPPIQRTSPDGKMEGMTVDTKMGTYTAQGADGVTTVTHVFETPGPLYHKVQKIETITNGVSSLTYRASYDETGRLLREIDAQGFMTTYADGNGNKIGRREVRPPSDPKLVHELKVHEITLLTALSKAPNEDARENTLEELAFFYIYQLGDLDKAMALIPQLTNNLITFNVKMHLILGDRNSPPQTQVQQLENLLKAYPAQQKLVDNIIHNKTSEENEDNLQ